MRWLNNCLVWPCACIVFACGEEAPSPLDTAGELWCDGLCKATRRCGAEQPQARCRSTCAAERPGLENISMLGAKSLGRCIARLSCEQAFDETEWEAAHEACWQDARGALEPTPHIRSFCAEYSETWFECGGWLATDECESTFGMWADEVVDRVATCQLSPTCGELRSCVETTFDTL